MVKTRWLLLLTALATLGSMTWMWFESETRTAGTLLSAAEERLDRTKPDYDTGLRELGLALQMARESDDRDLMIAILKRRVGVYDRRWAWDLSLQDCEYALHELAPDDPYFLDMAVSAAIGLDDLETALMYSRQLERVDRSGASQGALGRVRRLMGERTLDELRALLEDSLGDQAAKDVYASIRRLVAMPARSSQRFAEMDRLRALFVPLGESQEFARLTERATNHFDKAREGVIEALEYYPSDFAVSTLLELFLQAGRPDLASDVAEVALLSARIPGPQRSVLAGMQACLDIERPDRAREMFHTVRDANDSALLNFWLMAPQDLPAWCRVLTGIEDWGQLGFAANSFANRLQVIPRDQIGGQVVRFYMAWSDYKQGRSQWVPGHLDAFLGDRSRPQPIPSAQTEAWLAIADIGASTNDKATELRGLTGLVSDIPSRIDSPQLRRRVGNACRRLAMLRHNDGDHIQAEVAMAHALRLLPEGYSQLAPMWREFGELAIAAHGRRFLDDEGNPTAFTPPRDAGPYEQWLFAQHFTDFGRYLRAMTMIESLLRRYPGLPPVLELGRRTCELSGDLSGEAQMLAELAIQGLADEDAMRRLRSIPWELVPAETRLRWTRSAPRTASLVDVARQLVADGDSELALDALRQPSDEPPTGEALALWAEIAADQGRWPEAYGVLDRMKRWDPAFGAAVGLAVEIASKVPPFRNNADPLGAMLEKVMAANEPDLEGLLEASGTLLSRGQLEPAARLLAFLDAQNSPLTGRVVLRAAAVELAAGRRDSALEYIERADPFFDDGETGVGRLVLGVDSLDWRGVFEEAYRLSQGRFAEGRPYRQALLLGLQSKYAAALVALEEVLASEPSPDPLHELSRAALRTLEQGAPQDDLDADTRTLLGVQDAERDPRVVLAWLLALESPHWSAWVSSSLRELPDELGLTAWPSYLDAAATYRLGDAQGAYARLTEMVQQEPRVPFAWFLMERIETERAGNDETAPELLSLRADRIRAAGSEGLSPVQIAVVLAHTLELIGQRDRAIQVLQRALDEHPDDLALAVHVARKLVEADRLVPAIDAYNALLDDTEPPSGYDLVPEYLDLLRTAAARDEISVGAWWALLEALEAQRPEDPSVVREIARRMVETADDRSDHGVGRAWDLLARYRSRTRYRPIEELRHGEAQRWFDLFADYDAGHALEFARSELEVRPNSPAMWSLSAQALRINGRLSEALDEFGTILAIVPDPDIERRMAGLLAELGRDRDRIEALLGRDKNKRADPFADYLLARLDLEGSPVQREHAIRLLTAMWIKPEGTSEDVDRKDLGRTLALGLLMRGDPKDARAASKVILDTMALCDDPLEIDYFVALGHLARQLERAASG